LAPVAAAAEDGSSDSGATSTASAGESHQSSTSSSSSSADEHTTTSTDGDKTTSHEPTPAKDDEAAAGDTTSHGSNTDESASAADDLVESVKPRGKTTARQQAAAQTSDDTQADDTTADSDAAESAVVDTKPQETVSATQLSAAVEVRQTGQAAQTETATATATETVEPTETTAALATVDTDPAPAARAEQVAMITAAAASADAGTPPANPVAGVVLTVLSWLGWSPRPEAAAQFPSDPTPWAVLGWLNAVHPWFNTAPQATVRPGTDAEPEDGVAAGQVIATDLQNDGLTYALTRGPRNGTVVVDAAGNFRYVANSAAVQADSFAISVDDGHRAGTTVVTVSVDLTGSPTARQVIATAGHSRLDLPCGSACSVPVDWYFPDSAEAPNGIIWLQHGFGANAALYDRLAKALAEQTNSIVVAPSLTWLPLTGDGRWLNGDTMQQAVAAALVDRTALQASADQAAGRTIVLPERLVLTGHSAGGNLAVTVGGLLAAGGNAQTLLGVVMFDGVPVGDSIAGAVNLLPASTPVFQIASYPYVWNANGAGTVQLTAARPDQFTGIRLLGGSHIDAMQTSDLLISALAPLLTGYSPLENQLAVQTLAVGWILDMYDGTHDGVYGEHGSTIGVGDATGVVL